jgi:hypothetical protein
MSRVRARGEEIRRFILENVTANSNNISKLAMDKFGTSRQAINSHLRRLVQEGALNEKGNTKARLYALAALAEWHKSYPITGGPPEDVVWRGDIEPVIGKLPDNVRDIWSYGFTEMFNNARDHSGGTHITVWINKTAVTTEMMIADDGIGIFKKITDSLNLLDERHALFELTKGKLTTDPKHHTGEGIFFTSRVFDKFNILSGEVFFTHHFGKSDDWLLERSDPKRGTTVFLRLDNHTARTTKKVFDKYTGSEAEDYGFNKTVVPVELAQYGNDKLISRSQAKRVLARVELFKTVILDFTNVPTIGQAFADETFRVFVREHPSVELVAVNTNSEVKRMILRAESNVEPSPSASLSPSVNSSASPSPSPPPSDANLSDDDVS